MTRKYVANINLYFDEMKHSIVGDETVKKVEMAGLVKEFAKERRCTINQRTKKIFDASGKEVGEYAIETRVY